jgi:hypothetical protein
MKMLMNWPKMLSTDDYGGKLVSSWYSKDVVVLQENIGDHSFLELRQEFMSYRSNL